jgi:hypothetical protein
MQTGRVAGVLSEADVRGIVKREIGTLPQLVTQLQGLALSGVGVWRLLQDESCVLPGGTAATSGLVSNGGLNGLSTTGAPPVPFFDPAVYAVAGRSAKLRLQLALAVNATAPGSDFTLALQPVTAVGGGSGAVAYTLGASIASVALTAPGASAMAEASSADVDAPAAGYYALVLATSATIAANSRVVANCRAELRHV